VCVCVCEEYQTVLRVTYVTVWPKSKRKYCQLGATGEYVLYVTITLASPQYRTCFMSLIWNPNFWDGS